MESEHIIPQSEYNSFYKGYIDLSKQGKVLEGLVEGFHHALTFFQEVPTDFWDYRYAKGKWSPKEILLHLIDTERVFSYRALCIARTDRADLPGFDQDEFVGGSHADSRTPTSLINEFYALRKATVLQFASYSESDLLRVGTVDGNPMSLRAIGAIIHGHCEHHMAVLKERYVKEG